MTKDCIADVPRTTSVGGKLSRMGCVSALALLLAGCASEPRNVIANHIATTQEVQTQAARSITAQATPNAQWPAQEWWKAYHDETLNKLEEQTLLYSPDMSAAQARLKLAAAYAAQANTALFPSAQAQGNIGVTRQSLNAGFPATFRAFLPQGWNDAGTLNTGISLDLDLWGKNRAALRSSKAQAQAAAYEAQQVRLHLTAAVAQAYGELGRIHAAMLAQTKALEAHKQLRLIAQEKYAHGLINQAELDVEEESYQAIRASLAAIKEAEELTRHRIAIIAGHGTDYALDIAAPSMLPAAQLLPQDATLNLMGRRPDIMAARARIDAAQAQVEQAQRSYYPNLNLGALIGFQALGLNKLLQGASTYGNAGPALDLPFLHIGSLHAVSRGAQAQYEGAVAEYNRVLGVALEQLANTLSSRAALLVRLDAAQKSYDAASHAYRLTSVRTKAGIEPLAAQLRAQDNLVQAEIQLTDMKARAFSLDIALIQALGGEFAPASPPYEGK
jgi:NodT family efflux transporter outer membrane factor (OMF) lipoprotein